jgi:hypothetical protein
MDYSVVAGRVLRLNSLEILAEQNRLCRYLSPFSFSPFRIGSTYADMTNQYFSPARQKQVGFANFGDSHEWHLVKVFWRVACGFVWEHSQ